MKHGSFPDTEASSRSGASAYSVFSGTSCRESKHDGSPRASRTLSQETARFVGYQTHGSQTGDNMIGHRERQRVTTTWKNLEVWP